VIGKLLGFCGAWQESHHIKQDTNGSFYVLKSNYLIGLHLSPSIGTLSIKAEVPPYGSKRLENLPNIRYGPWDLAPNTYIKDLMAMMQDNIRLSQADMNRRFVSLQDSTHKRLDAVQAPVKRHIEMFDNQFCPLYSTRGRIREDYRQAL
jgi:hypothetical protein